MGTTQNRGRLDWLVEIAGAAALATAAAFAATKFAPVYGWSPSIAVLSGFGGMFAVAFVAMRIVPPETHQLALRDFDLAAELDNDSRADGSLDDVLLLDDLYAVPDEFYLDQPQIAVRFKAVAELLLDDPLPAPSPDSRVVQLFAEGRMPTAGQLKHRIDRHLASDSGPVDDVAIDATDALTDALAELRRSLRRA